ncbi:unnamed protein product [Durusdinium trenchii]|uniref:Uncharacterized protein n=2 Tax=Durusdinium trenchii TaxID=1381693 RepID=A0ABP0MGK7_9DINO
MPSTSLLHPESVEPSGHESPASFANYNVPNNGMQAAAPPAPPMRHATHKEKLPQYGSPYLCYPMIALKTPDGAQPTPMVAAMPLPLLHTGPTRARRGAAFL